MTVIWDAVPDGENGRVETDLVWNQPLFWSHVAADGLLALSFISIPAAIWIVAQRRPDAQFRWLLFLFVGFILACGVTHFLAVWTMWVPSYHTAAIVKMVAALSAIATAVAIWTFMPLILALPSQRRMEAVHAGLSAEIENRRAAEARLSEANATLEEGHHFLEQMCADIQSTAQEARASAERRADHLAMMSHEVRTPLHGIIGMLTMLRERVADPETLALVHRASEGADGLLNLLNDTLDYARAEASDKAAGMTPYRPAEIVEQVAGLFSAMAESKGLTLGVDIAPDAEGRALGDAVKVRQILSNIVSNAVKFTVEGHIGITLSLNCSAAGAEHLIVISDTGCGIPAADRARLFERYARGGGEAARQERGTGLGLALCQEMVERLGGTIDVESREGAGTTVTLTLPGAPLVEDGVGASLTGATVQRQLAGLRMLVVDDNDTNRLIARHALTGAGAIVHEAACGQAALSSLAETQADVILLDLSLPDLDGADVAALIRHGGYGPPDVPIVIVSAHARPEDSLRLLALGTGAFLSKPFRPAELVATVALALKDARRDTAEVASAGAMGRLGADRVGAKVSTA
ncbi:MAG: ATP-binding protein [Pseudomonadota bacterium]